MVKINVMKKHTSWVAFIVLGALALSWWALPAIGQNAEPQLPARGVMIEIDSPERALYRIAVPSLQGGTVGTTAAEVLRNDFKLISLFTVLDARSFMDSQPATLDIRTSDWSVVGAQAVIKGKLTQTGSGVSMDMRLYELAKGNSPTLQKSYRGSLGDVRKFMHKFANEVLLVLTGEAGAFDSRITFARRLSPGRKDVYVSDFDGHGLGRVSKGNGIAMLPSFGPGGIWYSILSKYGMYITRTGANERPVIKSQGLNMGVTSCGNRIYFSSTRSGNAEIFSANGDGSDVRQLTHHRSIDVSPACGPTGQLAFVSNRQGSPQVYTMNTDGSGVKRITYRGDYNQTPTWCPDPKKSLLAFTGRSGDYDIFVINLQTGEYTRLTQGQGSNKDPAFSPDCRMVAFASSRGGIYLSSIEGLNHNRVVPGGAETIRWSR